MYADARMTIRLPGEYLKFAQEYAKERDMTLSELVVGYFQRLKESLAEKDELDPSVREMIGIIPSGTDAKDDYDEYLMRKHS